MYMSKLVSRFIGIIFVVVVFPITLIAQITLEQSLAGGSPQAGEQKHPIERLRGPGDTIRSIPTPEDRIMGIEWVRDTLYVLRLCYVISDPSLLYKLDPADGSVLSQFLLPFPSAVLGITFDGNDLWVVKWEPDHIIYQITTSGIPISSFPAPSSYPRGIAWDGEYLWIGDAQSEVLYQVDTLGTIIRTVSMTGVIDWSMGMVWVPEHTNGHLWVNDYYGNDINQLDVSGSNAVLIQDFPHPAPGNYLEGICYDGQYLWVADYNIARLWQIDDGVMGIVDDAVSVSSRTFQLSQNYPNPFRQSTSIRYFVPRNAHVELAIYNIQGQLVRTIVKRVETAGIHSISWDGRDTEGRSVISGIYFYKLESSNSIKEVRKMLLLR
ncbi:MAG: T9SS type A sorting domain-containing protein [Candidatus Cloacimonadota bacterium]|nr:MAG: T9SS type A sorting domain-containing protein [Candidatus Cloacimonadota bacterium]